MAIPTNLLTRREQQDKLTGSSRQIKQFAINLRDRSAAGSINTEEIRAFAGQLRDARNSLLSLPQTAEFAAYVQESYESDGWVGDIVVDYQATLAEIDLTIAWIRTVAVPVMWGGYDIDAAANEIIPTFPPESTGGLRDRLNALIATID